MKTLAARIQEKQKLNENDLKPGSMLLELTNACNHKCLFCSHRKMKRSVKMMELSFAKRMLDEAYDMGIREVGLFMMGESFLYKDLGAVIQYAKEKGYEYVYITTNGVLASEEKVKEIFDAGVDSIKFSINAVENETYELIHGRDELETVLKNLKWIYDYRETTKRNVNIFVSSVLSKYNHNEKKIREILEPICDELVLYPMINYDGLIPEVELYLREEVEPLRKTGICTAPCPRIFNCVYVTVEGYLNACCTDVNNYLAYADLKNHRLKEAWNNELIVEFRKRHLENRLEGSLCFNCINGTKEAIHPLVEEYVSAISPEEINNCDEVCKRIQKYEYSIIDR